VIPKKGHKLTREKKGEERTSLGPLRPGKDWSWGLAEKGKKERNSDSHYKQVGVVRQIKTHQAE